MGVEECYAAVIVKAADDYKKGIMGYRTRYLGNYNPAGNLGEVKRFFKSKRFAFITNIDREMIMKKIENEVRDEAINALEKTIDHIKSGRQNTIKLAGANEQNHTYCIPPCYEDEFVQAMKRLLVQLYKEKKEAEDDDES